jgi:hypothetical protein
LKQQSSILSRRDDAEEVCYLNENPSLPQAKLYDGQLIKGSEPASDLSGHLEREKVGRGPSHPPVMIVRLSANMQRVARCGVMTNALY